MRQLIIPFCLIVPVLLASHPFFSSAQSAWQVFNTSNSDLPNNTVRALKVDSAGLLWVGTDAGLAHFDGTYWTTYTTSNSAIPGNRIRAIEVDYDGDIWVGTLNEGVAEFDGTNWNVYHTGNSGLPDNFVKAIAFDANEKPWFGTTGGLACMADTGWAVWNIFNSELFTNNIGSIAVDAFNVKHIGTVNGGLNLIGPVSANVTVFNSITADIPDNTLLAVALDTSQTILWAATPAAGLIGHLGNNSWLWYNTLNSAMPSNSCNDLFIDPHNVKYLSTYDAGLIVFDGSNFSNFNALNSGMPDNFSLAVAKDPQNVVWIGMHAHGLVRYEKALGISYPLQHVQPVYPNPAKAGTRLQLPHSWKKGTLELYTTEGRLLHRQLKTVHTTRYALPHPLTPGVYRLQFRSEKGMDIRRIVVH